MKILLCVRLNWKRLGSSISIVSSSQIRYFNWFTAAFKGALGNKIEFITSELVCQLIPKTDNGLRSHAAHFLSLAVIPKSRPRTLSRFAKKKKRIQKIRMSGLSSHLSPENRAELLRIVRKICQPGKGILAADETPMAMEDRFKDLDVQNCPEVNGIFFPVPLLEMQEICTRFSEWAFLFYAGTWLDVYALGSVCIFEAILGTTKYLYTFLIFSEGTPVSWNYIDQKAV